MITVRFYDEVAKISKHLLTIDSSIGSLLGPHCSSSLLIGGEGQSKGNRKYLRTSSGVVGSDRDRIIVGRDRKAMT